MAPLPERVRTLIEAGPLAHLVTMNANGSPQVTVVWIGIEGDEIVSGHLYRHRKVRNVERDPTVALSSRLRARTSSACGTTSSSTALPGSRREARRELLQRLAQYTSGPACSSRPCPTRRLDSSRGSRSIASPASAPGATTASHRR